jgi:hypothetical protein
MRGVVEQRASMLIPHKAGCRVLAAVPVDLMFFLHLWPHTRDMKSATANLGANSKILRAWVALSYNLRPQRRWLPVASRIVPVWVCAGAYNGADGELSTFFRRFLPAVLVLMGVS